MALKYARDKETSSFESSIALQSKILKVDLI